MKTTRTTPANTPKTSPRSLAGFVTRHRAEVDRMILRAQRRAGLVEVKPVCDLDRVKFLTHNPKLRRWADEQLADEAAPVAPRWTLAPGRWICYDGKPIVFLGVGEDPQTAERSCPPYAADDLAHLIVHLLASSYLPGISNEPLSFPVPEIIADESRAATPTTLPAEEVSRG